jgi:hypothetical protein
MESPHNGLVNTGAFELSRCAAGAAAAATIDVTASGQILG